MNKIIAIILAIICCTSSVSTWANTMDSTNKMVIKKDRIQLFDVDNLGNIYVVNNQQQLVKYNKDLDSVQVYNNVQLFGQLTSIDVSNPLKLILFYKDFSTIVVLDRFLAERSVIDLKKIGIYNASAIAVSYDNMIWLYDEMANTIKKINDNGEVALAYNDFRTLFDNAPYPSKIMDNNGLNYIYDSQIGLLVMDYYGAYKTTYPITKAKSINLINGNIVYIKNNSLNILQPKALKDISQPLPKEIANAKKIKIDNNTIWYTTDLGLFAYNY